MIYNPPMEPYLEVIYQDRDLIVINKPSGLLSVPGQHAHNKDSVQSRAKEQFPTATTVHRLDMETSGLIVMALNKPAHVNISQQFEKRLIKKKYLARVYGQVKEDAGSIDKPLICDWPNRPRQMVDYEKGKQALTHWQVLQREDATTLLELKPVTGRSHQLRVHLLSIGHVIVGDQLYADGEALAYSERLQLHSQYIKFRHPYTDKDIEFDLPASFV